MLVSCNNVTVEGINWKRCGSSNNQYYPAIKFHNSSNITVKGCSFQHSVRKIIVLSKVSGSLHIKNCKFTNNNQYEGHGTAIHYLSVSTYHILKKLLVEDCNFTDNGANRVAGSVIYVASPTNKFYSHLIIRNSVFSRNKGVSIYISHHSLHIQGEVLLEYNIAINGGGIFSNNSTMTFHDQSDITFFANSALTDCGAIFLTNSSVYLEVNSNWAESSGGAVFAVNMSHIVSGRA